MKVYGASMWQPEAPRFITPDESGEPIEFDTTHEAREYAVSHGFEGIRILLPKQVKRREA